MLQAEHISATALANRFVRFSYLSNNPDGRRLLPHQLRDGDAVVEIFEPLRDAGLTYGGVFINWPYHHGKQDTSLRDLSVLEMKESDLLLLTTRPPLNDDGKKPLRKSRTELEAKLFRALEHYCLEECSRTNVKVLPHVAKKFNKGFENRSAVEYYCIRKKRDTMADGESLCDASYRSLYGRGGEGLSSGELNNRSAGYIVHLPIPGLPRLVAIWGASGVMTYLWSHLLATQKRDLLRWVLSEPQRGRFAMVEIEMTEGIPERSSNLDFCRAWRVEEAAKCEL